MLTKIVFVVLFLIKANTGEDSWEEKNKKLHKTPDNYGDFQFTCAYRLEGILKDAVRSQASRIGGYVKFLAPCENCYLQSIKFSQVDPDKVQGKFIADDLFQSIFTLPVESYNITCDCSRAVTKKGIDDALEQMMQQHASDKCDKVQLNYTHNMEPEKVKKCFLELDPNHDGKNVGSEKLSMVGGNIFANVTTVAHIHDRYVKVIYKDVTVMSPPTPVCNESPEDHEFCQCLEQRGFFANLPQFMLNNFLACDTDDIDKVKTVHRIKNDLHCKEDINEFL